MNIPKFPGAVVLFAFAALGAVGPLQALDQSSSATSGLISPEQFKTPPRDAGVHVWWHWLDGAISREGITKDLETMKAQGVVQATILNVGLFNDRDFGVPRVPFASPEWFGMYRWAITEAARLNLTIGVHNCDGWSSSGGPWITPEQSMKQFTWTTTFAKGGQSVDVQLPQPGTIEGFYRDVAVVAYRSAKQPSAFQQSHPRISKNDKDVPTTTLTDGNPVSSIIVERGDRLVLSSDTPFDFSRIALHLRRPFMWDDPAKFTAKLTVETSANGRDYQPAAGFSAHGLNRNQLFDLPRSATSFVRVTLQEMSDTDAWIPLELAELELLRPGEAAAYTPSVPFIGEKTGSTKGSEGAVNVPSPETSAISPADIVMLTDRVTPDGRLRWDAPEGSWAILRFGYTSTGATNSPATREGRGLECDKLDPAAVDHHFHAFPEKLINEAGKEAGKTLRFILVDSWEAGFQNWTARFPAEFEKRRGYSLLPWLPVLVGEVVGSGRETEAVLFDFRQTIADLIRENYYDRFATLLHQRNVELHAEVIYGGSGYPPLDVLRSTEHVDLPMLEFWTSADKNSLLHYSGGEWSAFILPVSAAAGYGKRLVGSEAYTGFAHYSESPADLKPFGDRGYASGINRMILHSSVHQPTDDKPGMTLGQFASHFNRNNLYWPHASTWLEYQARIQSLLGAGAPVFDVLYFLGDQLPQEFSPNPSTTLPSGYTLTAVNADILASRITVADGRLRLNGTGDAALLSLPPTMSPSLSTLQRLEDLIQQGAHVYGPKPTAPLSAADNRALTAYRALADKIWGKLDGQKVVSQPYGKGGVHWGQPIGHVLASLGVAPKFSAIPTAAKEFLFTQRQVDGVEIVFVANQTDQAIDRECLFRVEGKAPEIWDPESGDVSRPAAFQAEGKQLRVPVHFKPRQALLFVFRPGLPTLSISTVKRDGVAVFPSADHRPTRVPSLRFAANEISVEPAVSGKYEFALSDGRTISGTFDAPELLSLTITSRTLEPRGAGIEVAAKPIAIADLRPWTDYESPDLKYLSGEATYRLNFTAASRGNPGDTLRLELGGFESVAEVSLNGQALGTFWNPGMPIDVTGRLQPENELIVKVVNVYRNRFIGDFVQYGKVRNLKTSSPIQQFLSAERPLKPSGLFGPITVTRVPAQFIQVSAK